MKEDFLPLRDEVFQTLRTEILTGQLLPGERLMELHLASRLGVSRTPIREAIQMLEQEGLVTMIPRRGAEVARINARIVKDVLELRRALDVLCAELACERISPEDKERLKDACKAFENSTKQGSVIDVASRDVELHNIITTATANEKLIALINNLSQQIYRFRFEYLKEEKIYGALVEEHRAIYQAIVDGDKEAAARAARVHIDNQEKSIIQMLER